MEEDVCAYIIMPSFFPLWLYQQRKAGDLIMREVFSGSGMLKAWENWFLGQDEESLNLHICECPFETYSFQYIQQWYCIVNPKAPRQAIKKSGCHAFRCWQWNLLTALLHCVHNWKFCIHLVWHSVRFKHQQRHSVIHPDFGTLRMSDTPIQQY